MLRDDVLDALGEAKTFLEEHEAAQRKTTSDAGPQRLYVERFMLALRRRGLRIAQDALERPETAGDVGSGTRTHGGD